MRLWHILFMLPQILVEQRNCCHFASSASAFMVVLSPRQFGIPLKPWLIVLAKFANVCGSLSASFPICLNVILSVLFCMYVAHSHTEKLFQPISMREDNLIQPCPKHLPELYNKLKLLPLAPLCMSVGCADFVMIEVAPVLQLEKGHVPQYISIAPPWVHLVRCTWLILYPLSYLYPRMRDCITTIYHLLLQFSTIYSKKKLVQTKQYYPK